MQKLIKLFTFFVLTSLFMVGCSDDDDDNSSQPAPTLSVSPTTASVQVGSSVNLSVTIASPAGFSSLTADNSDVSISNLPSSGATTGSATATFSPTSAGSVTINFTVTDSDSQTGTASVTVTVTEATTGGDLTQGNAGLTANTATVGGVDLISIEGDITSDFTIPAGANYWLNNTVFVKAGATLNIGAGATIYGNPEASGAVPAFIAIERDAQINAVGDANNPVVMTSGNELVGSGEIGDWGGLIILGNGIINVENGGGGNAQAEGTNLIYGGNDNTDNSGTLRYVRVEYAGASITAEEDMNGIAFYGVGSGTTVEYVQVYQGADDGVEFYGGAVNAKYLVVIDARDDQVDYTQGWQGKLQYVVTVNSQIAGDSGFECDNYDQGITNTPFSQPQISNVTVVNYNNIARGRGIRLRNGTKGNFHNVLVVDHDPALAIEDESQNFDANGELVFANSVITGEGEKIRTGENSRIAVDGSNKTNLASPTLANDFVGVYKAENGAEPADANAALDNFFDATDYVGAADPNNAWWTGWVRLSNGNIATDAGNPTIPVNDLTQGNAGLTAGTANIGGVDLISIEGDITSDFTIPAGANYWLNNTVFVKAGATLNIGAGATIYGNPEASGAVPAFIAIEKDAQINAVGTASNPVVMTSGNELVGSGEIGDWGGLIILGNGIINVENGGGGNAQAEGTNLIYGGNDNTDNSGTLRYVRVEYAGASITAEEDMNGIAFYGVGSGTTVEYVQVYQGADDGVEFYGGAVNAKYLVVIDARDDQVDYTQGWQGKLQYVVTVNSQIAGDSGFECDNYDQGITNTPFSQPQISNVTVVNYNNIARGRGIRLRNGTKGNFHNVLIIDHDPALAIEDESQNFDANGELVFANSVIAGAGEKIRAGDGSQIAADASNVQVDASPVALTDDFVGVVTDGAQPVDANAALDTFFDATDYVGAANPSDAWWTGWVRLSNGNIVQ